MVQRLDRSASAEAGAVKMLAAALTALALVWTLLVVTAPVASARSRGALPSGFWALSAVAYHAGSLVCHQRPERSFHLAGEPMAVCARCFGLYAAGAAGLLIAWGLGRRLSPAAVKLALALSVLPIAVTVALEWVGAIETSNLFRMTTGLPPGLVGGVVINALLRGRA